MCSDNTAQRVCGTELSWYAARAKRNPRVRFCSITKAGIILAAYLKRLTPVNVDDELNKPDVFRSFLEAGQLWHPQIDPSSYRPVCRTVRSTVKNIVTRAFVKVGIVQNRNETWSYTVVAAEHFLSVQAVANWYSTVVEPAQGSQVRSIEEQLACLALNDDDGDGDALTSVTGGATSIFNPDPTSVPLPPSERRSQVYSVSGLPSDVVRIGTSLQVSPRQAPSLASAADSSRHSGLASSLRKPPSHDSTLVSSRHMGPASDQRPRTASSASVAPTMTVASDNSKIPFQSLLLQLVDMVFASETLPAHGDSKEVERIREGYRKHAEMLQVTTLLAGDIEIEMRKFQARMEDM